MVSSLNNDFYSLLLITIVSVLVFFYIYGKQGMSMTIRNLLMLGLLMRLTLLFADYYKWFPIFDSGLDSEMFHRVSAANVNAVNHYYRGGYTKFLTYFYILTDTSRLLAQYINILLSLGLIFLVIKSMNLLQIIKKKRVFVVTILCCMPTLNIYSAILLREAWVEFFVALSLYHFIKWYVRGTSSSILFSIASVLAAAYMHAGVIVIIFGYILAFLSYNPKTGKVTFSASSIVSLIFLAVIMLAASSYMDLFTGKFDKYESMDDIVAVTNKTGGGGADYLKWISTDSVAMSLAFAPLKMFYFLCAPLPTEWRGLNDIVGFLIDGAIYMYMLYCIWKFKPTNSFNYKLQRYLLAAFLITTFIFAYGTTNAGTALRHRNKLVSVAVLTFALSGHKPIKKITI